MLRKIFLSFFLITFLFVSSVNGQEEILPDPGMLPTSQFYFLKILGENIGTFFTFGEESKTERLLELSEKRLVEAKVLAERGENEKVEQVMNRYEKHLSKAYQYTERAREKGDNVDGLLIKVSEATFKHQNILIDVYEDIPEEAKPGIEKAMQEGLKGYEETMKNVSSEEERDKIIENISGQIESVGNKAGQLEEKGVMVPEVSTVEEIKKNLPEIQIPQMQKKGR